MIKSAATRIGRPEMAEALTQAANLFDALAGTRDRYTRSRAEALRAAAIEFEGAPETPAEHDVAELLAVVSLTIGLREQLADGRWAIDEETMGRLEAAYAPIRKALAAPSPVPRGEPDGRRR